MGMVQGWAEIVGPLVEQSMATEAELNMVLYFGTPSQFFGRTDQIAERIDFWRKQGESDVQIRQRLYEGTLWEQSNG
jgi:hypothetical protein